MDPTPYIPQPYEDRMFNDLPMFSDVFRALEEKPVPDPVYDQIRSVFLRYSVYQTIGLTVLHRHFDLETGEKLVEYNSVSAPWRMPDSLKVPKGKVFPKAWAFDVDGELYPYEFGYDPDVVAPSDTGLDGGVYNSTTFNHAFIKEIRDVLTHNGLTRTHGLCLISPVVWDPSAPRMLEFTAGRTSIMIPLSDSMSAKEIQSVVEATWVFPCVSSLDDVEGGGTPSRLKICAKECYGHKDG
ncbi:MAG: hypothetical protein M1813_009835 [Trichoglossum hirsutum]|nr:MAG: hypothetical protein M1813_009835 [Trichoglossum hirsutum]